MKTKIRYTTSAVLIISSLLLFAFSFRHSRPAHSDPERDLLALKATFDQVLLPFEANDGQTDPHVRYLARGSGYTVFLTAKDAVLVLQDRHGEAAALRLNLADGNDRAPISALGKLSGKSNYFIGNDPKKWRTDLPLFSKVRYATV